MVNDLFIVDHSTPSETITGPIWTVCPCGSENPTLLKSRSLSIFLLTIYFEYNFFKFNAMYIFFVNFFKNLAYYQITTLIS